MQQSCAIFFLITKSQEVHVQAPKLLSSSVFINKAAELITYEIFFSFWAYNIKKNILVQLKKERLK